MKKINNDVTLGIRDDKDTRHEMTVDKQSVEKLTVLMKYHQGP